MRKGEIEGRHDPFYYIPSIVKLEKKIRRISTQRLKDFIVAVSSGATPLVKEEEKFYRRKCIIEKTAKVGVGKRMH